jgi:non-canonical purine NTP pyrophosphatase (RdgB/HAM1 family)
MKKWLIASHNTHKIKEFKTMLAGYDIKIIGLGDINDKEEVVEDGHSFIENARLKAFHFAKKHQLPTLADDSGLCVDALNGMPGIYSARYSGHGDEANNIKLLKAMKNHKNRNAHFVAALVLAFPDGKSFETQASVEGLIQDAPKGSQGFGYDPIFFVPELNMTFAEVDPWIKHQYSHRGKAILKLKEQMHEIIDYK